MSSVSDEKAIITLEVELVSKVTGGEGADASDGFFKDTPEDLTEIIKQAIDDSIDEAVVNALEEQGIDMEGLKNITEAVKDLDSKGIGNITSMAKNPAGFMENTFIKTLGRAGPYGALTAAIIAAIIGTPELIKAVVQAFAVKGGFLNQDYRYSQEEFLNQQFDRITQFKRLTGDDPVITVTTKGFIVGDPDFEGNSLVDANIARTARIGLRDTSYGYIHGI